MRFLRDHRFSLIFFVLLAFCSVMVFRQLDLNHYESRHVELREALILLQSRGYTNESVRIYQKLLRDVPGLPGKALMDDFQRTRLLVDPASTQPENPIWNYHWYVSNELDKRSESTLVRARKLAGE